MVLNKVATHKMASTVSLQTKIYVLFLVFLVRDFLPQANACANHTLDATFSPLHLPKGCYGPTAVAFDSKGEGPYTGSSYGRIFKYDAETTSFKEFCVGNPHRYIISFLCFYLYIMFLRCENYFSFC